MTPDHRSTAVVYGGDRRPWWWTIFDHCRTTVDHHRTIDQPPGNGGRPAVNRPGQDRVMGQVWIESWAGSGSNPPRGMPRVSHVCPRGIHVDADMDINNYAGLNLGPPECGSKLSSFPEDHREQNVYEVSSKGKS
nr:hypothetical protein [Tanacetum cinerariifolium]